MKKRLVKILTAGILVILMTVNVFAVSVNNDFADGQIGDDWSVSSSDSSAVSGVDDSSSNLLIRHGNEELASSLMADYSYSEVGGDICYIDMDFSYTAGSQFQIRNILGESWRGCWRVENDTFYYFEGSGWISAATLTPDDKHTIRLVIDSGSTLDIYIDGEMVAEDVVKPSGKPNQFSVYMPAKNSILSIHRFAVMGTTGSFEEDFSDETTTSLKAKGWNFPISTDLSYVEINSGEDKTLAFEAATRAKMWLLEDTTNQGRDDICSIHGEPSEVTIKFMYERGASLQLRIMAKGSATYVAAFHLSNNRLQHQYSGSGFATIARNLSPMTEYTLKVSCNTLTANSVNVYLNGNLVSSNRPCMSGGTQAPRWIEMLNLTDAATGSDVYVNYVGTTTQEKYVSEIAQEGARVRSEDYTQTATESSWREISGYSLPSLKALGGGSVTTKENYMYISRVSEGEDYTASYALPQDITYPLVVSTDIAYKGYGTNIIAVRDGDKNAAGVKIEDGFLQGAYTKDGQMQYSDAKKSIAPYKKYKLTFYMTGKTMQIYLDGRYFTTVANVTDAEEVAFINAAQQTDGASKGRLFSTLYIYGVSAETAEDKSVTVENARLIDLDGNQVSGLQADGTQCVVKLKNDGAVTGAYVLLAIYEGEDLCRVINDSVLLPANTITDHTMNIPIFSNPDDLDAKLFVWNIDYSPIVASGEVSDLLAIGDETDFSDIQRKYINDDFSWDVIDAFPAGYYCEADGNVKVKNDDEGNYVSIDKTSSSGKVDLVKYFPPMTNKMSFEVSLMSASTSGTKIGPDLKTSVFRDDSSVIKMQMTDGYIYTTDGAENIRLMAFEAGKWYDVRLDIDLDKSIYDVYVDGTLVKAGCSVNGNITSGHLGQVRFGMASGQTGNLCIDNVNLYSSERTEEAIALVPEQVKGFTVDFDEETAGTFPASWRWGVKNNATASVVQEVGTNNKYLHMVNDGSSTENNRIIYNFPSPLSGKIQVEMKLKVDNYTEAVYQTIIMEDEKIRFALRGNWLECFDATRNWTRRYWGVTVGNWHNIKLLIDTATDSYDVYVNGSLAIEDVTFVASAGDISNLWIQLAGGASSMAIDDIKVTHLGGEKITAPEGFETTPRDDVPENSDWMKKYQAAPTGKVVEAESMTLVNFEAVDKANANGGKAIQVSGAGNASATYTFDGESGDYAIKVGYLENELKKDSTFRVFHNGEEIDYWYGQFDDGLLHVRDVKNKRHIEKGDVFVIEGYDGEDPTTVDYIQFSDAIEPDFERGYLIQEEFHAPGNYARSSWEVSEAGGSARIMNGTRNFGIMDNSITENVWAKRAILPQNGVVSSEFDMIYVTPNDGITMSFRDGEKEIVRFVTEGSRVYAENLMGDRVTVISGYQANRQYKAKVIMDIPNKEITVIASGGTVSTMEMKSEIEKIDNFYMYTGKESKGYLKLKSLDVFTGYTVNETFKALDAGVTPYNWTITGGASVAQVNNEALFDRMALNMPSGSTASHSYTKLSGTSTAKFSFLMKGDGTLTTTIGNAKVTVEDGDLYIEAGEKVKIWDNIKPNYVYYNVLLEQNAETGKLDVYVNNIKKATLDFNLVHDKIQFAVTGTSAVVDHIVMHDGIVTSDVPEVEAVDTGDYIIGMQTCDLWHEGEHFGWDCVRQYDNRTPLVGYYDDADQTAVDWEIKYWAEHGISVYAPCWYRDFTGTALRSGTNDGKLEAFKHSRYSDEMKFMVVYENSGGFTSENDFLNYVMNYWIEEYIKHPSYLVVDNKPVIAIWNNYYFAENAGGDEANRQLFEKAEAMLRNEGFDGAIWITNWNGSDENTAQTQLTRGYDYVYYYGSGAPIEEQTKKFADQQNMGLIDGIMSISQGWGAEAWGLSPRKTNLTLDEFRRGLEYTKNVYMKGYDEDSLGAKMMLFGNWNEIGEGHMYVPSKLTGFGYLDQIREVFGVNAGEHTDIVPENTLDALYPGLWD